MQKNNIVEPILHDLIESSDVLLMLSELDFNPIRNLRQEDIIVLFEARNLIHSMHKDFERELDQKEGDQNKEPVRLV